MAWAAGDVASRQSCQPCQSCPIAPNRRCRRRPQPRHVRPDAGAEPRVPGDAHPPMENARASQAGDHRHSCLWRASRLESTCLVRSPLGTRASCPHLAVQSWKRGAPSPLPSRRPGSAATPARSTCSHPAAPDPQLPRRAAPAAPAISRIPAINITAALVSPGLSADRLRVGVFQQITRRSLNLLANLALFLG